MAEFYPVQDSDFGEDVSTKRRYHEFEINTHTESLRELGIEDSIRSKCVIDLNTVVTFYDSYDKQKEPMTVLTLSNGNDFGIYCEYNEFKKLMNLR